VIKDPESKDGYLEFVNNLKHVNSLTYLHLNLGRISRGMSVEFVKNLQ